MSLPLAFSDSEGCSAFMEPRVHSKVRVGVLSSAIASRIASAVDRTRETDHDATFADRHTGRCGFRLVRTRRPSRADENSRFSGFYIYPAVRSGAAFPNPMLFPRDASSWRCCLSTPQVEQEYSSPLSAR